MIQFGRSICNQLAAAESREWLVTNGIGGYACGTIAGLLTRHYHGVLIAALNPPVERTLLLTKLDETVFYGKQVYPLFTNRWGDRTVEPKGYQRIERFYLDGTIPVWQFAIADARLSKRIWMQPGENTTYVSYTLDRASHSLSLFVKAFVNYRNHHGGTTMGDWQVTPVAHGLQVQAFSGATPLYIRSSEGQFTQHHDWYRRFDLAIERYRGTGSTEDHLHVATVELTLQAGQTITLVASTQSSALLEGQQALTLRQDNDQSLLNHGQCGDRPATPNWIRQLVLAADQFVVKRPVAEEPDGKTVIAGYPWFNDWGRDTMISLPGLTVAAGRPEIARPILRTFARYLNQGMLPNVFPDQGNRPEYNTVDAILWYFEAIAAYYFATQDQALLADLFPALTEVITWHQTGTRYNIQVDPKDGLLYAGEAGVQLTWMDAKVDDWVVTPRIGKPVEVNALWYNALCIMAEFATQLGKSATEYQQLAEQTRKGFQRFWLEDHSYCCDVLDTPDGQDSSLRPNQIFAVSLPSLDNPLGDRYPALLTPHQQKSVVDIVAQTLLTSYGLRSLSPQDPNYRGRYGGTPYQRDGGYHQGTVWGWLLGPFVQAHLRVYQHPTLAMTFLEPIADHLQDGGLGSISEIFDGNIPHTPRGCFAQAWSVAETLRAWMAIQQASKSASG